MTATTNMLTLRTGGEYHEAIVITTHMSLEKIRERDAVLQRAEVVADVQGPGGAVAGEDPFFI